MIEELPSSAPGGAGQAFRLLHDELRQYFRNLERTGERAHPAGGGRPAEVMAAALQSDDDAMRRALSRASGDADPDLPFLADWAGFWAHGASWPSPLASARPRRPAWQQDHDWMAGRRRGAHLEQRSASGVATFLADPGPLRAVADINGHEAAIILDTGAPSSLLSRDFAARAGLVTEDLGRHAHDGAGLSAAMRPARAATVSFGTWEGRNLPFDVVDLSAQLGADGILAPFDLFGRVGLTFDVASRALTIGVSPPDGWTACPVLWSQGVCSLRVSIAGLPVLALLDTGAGQVVIALERLTAALRESARHSFHSATALGDVAITSLGLQSVALPGQPGEILPLYAKATPPDSEPPLPRLADAYLGRSWFERHGLHFPATRGRVWIGPKQGDPA